MTQPKRNKILNALQTMKGEVKKTGVIGKKMLMASRTNSQLKESYSELGRLAYKAIKDEELDWKNPKLKNIVSIIEACEKDLLDIEKEVQKIKFAEGPYDISKDED